MKLEDIIKGNKKMKRYKIVRMYYQTLNKRPRTIKKGLTLEEAQAHCKDPKTRKAGIYFDGYEEQ